MEFFITSKTQNQGRKNLEETGLAYEDKHTAVLEIILHVASIASVSGPSSFSLYIDMGSFHYILWNIQWSL